MPMSQLRVDDRIKCIVIIQLERQLEINENHDLAIARSSSSHADTGLRVAFKCLIHCHCPDCLAGGI